MAKVVTANVLETGDVVYLSDGGAWVRDLTKSAVANDAAEVAALEAEAAAAAARQYVTAVYTMDVRLVEGRPEPMSVRERIRAALGPTV